MATQSSSSGFLARSARAQEVDDRSRKGSIDLPIRDLVNEINQVGRDTVFTTSSCSGRVSLVAEATKGKRTKGKFCRDDRRCE